MSHLFIQSQFVNKKQYACLAINLFINLLFNFFISLQIYSSVYCNFFSYWKKQQDKKKADKKIRTSHTLAPADRRGLDHDQVNNFPLLSYLLPLICVFQSILYYMYIQGNTTHNRKRADECVKCFLKAFKTSRSRSFNKTESHTQTVKLLSGEFSVFQQFAARSSLNNNNSNRNNNTKRSMSVLMFDSFISRRK